MAVAYKILRLKEKSHVDLVRQWPQIAFLREDSIPNYLILYLATQSALLKWENREGRTRKGSRMVTKNIGTEIMYNMHPSKNREKYLNAFAAFPHNSNNTFVVAGRKEDVITFIKSIIDDDVAVELMSPSTSEILSSPKVHEIYGSEIEIGCLLSSLAVKDL